jgi:hypothetical protein
VLFAKSNYRFSLLISFVLAGMLILSGCQTDDCLNCVELPPPVVPTGVHSISGDNEVIVQWYDISYAPYDGQYNANVTGYVIYSRIFEPGDELDNSRTFYYMGEVAWDENFDGYSGLHWYVDDEVQNGVQYEYAVSSINANELESALSYELVTDAPLPMSILPVELYDVNGSSPHFSGFDFSALDYGRVDPRPLNTTADILVFFQDGVPYLQTIRSSVHVQDFGVFTDSYGQLVFEGVSWAPGDGYSSTGVLELIRGHIYVIEIVDYQTGEVHYAKLGITGVSGVDRIQAHWAYQLIEGLPELAVPEDPKPSEEKPKTLSL